MTVAIEVANDDGNRTWTRRACRIRPCEDAVAAAQQYRGAHGAISRGCQVGMTVTVKIAGNQCLGPAADEHGGAIA